MSAAVQQARHAGTAVLGFEDELWRVADELWANSGLQPSEYAVPVLALLFLRYAERSDALEVPAEARFARLAELPEDVALGEAVNAAMAALEASNPQLRGVLPKTYARFEAHTLASLLRSFAQIPAGEQGSGGDTFGRIYEYFLAKLAPRTLQKGGEYFTPASVVRLIVEIVEPFHGRLLDPACGSGGMFIQSARFVAEHQAEPAKAISIHGVEKVAQTLSLAKMSLAIHGLEGDLREANTYYEDPHDSVGRFDFVMANPPFNQRAVDKQRVAKDTRRFPIGAPSVDNANLLWVQLCLSALNERGRAGLVLANSAASASGSEAKLRERLLERGAVDVMLELPSNLFYTVALPVTLWFFDRAKPRSSRADTLLFIDARELYQQVDRTHRELSRAQVEYLANVVRLYRGEAPEDRHGGGELLAREFPDQRYRDVPGLCRAVPLAEVRERGCVLSPGRYVGYRLERSELDARALDRRVGELRSELAELDASARALELEIAAQLELLAGGQGEGEPGEGSGG